MLKEIEKSICVEPEFLNGDIKQHIFNKAVSTWVGKCTKEDGYILKIHSIKKILNNHISPSTTSIIFELLLKAEVMKPEISMNVEAKVNMIVSQGIFVCADEKLNILIPLNNILDYEFDEAKGAYVSTKSKKLIKNGDFVDVKITAIRYEKNNFNCIGELI
jgi:DNA-directed RNA polymerase subunit E'/Rpb7